MCSIFTFHVTIFSAEAQPYLVGVPTYLYQISCQISCQTRCVMHTGVYILSGAYEPPKAARSVQLRIIAQNGICIYSST